MRQGILCPSTARRSPSAAPEPPPERVPPPDKFPPFDYNLMSSPGTDSQGRAVHLWGPLKITAPTAIERAVFEKALRPVLGAHRVLEHLGYPLAALATKESPLCMALYATPADVAKAAASKNNHDSYSKPDGRVFATLAYNGLGEGSAQPAASGANEATPLTPLERQAQSATVYQLHGKRSVVPGWLYTATKDYAALIPWADGWPQHSHARIAMQSYLAGIAEQKAFLITPALIDHVLKQPVASIRNDAAEQHAASLVALFYLRHLHDDGKGSALKTALASTTEQQKSWRGFLTQLAAYNEVWEQIKADPRSVALPDGRYSFPPDYSPPPQPSEPLTEDERHAATESLNKALLAMLGPKPGETIVVAMKQQGFGKGIANDSGDIASTGTTPGAATPDAETPASDLTPDYSAVKPTRPHLPLANRTWPVEIMVSAAAMNPALVPGANPSDFVFRAGRFEFHATTKLDLPLVKDIARVFTMLEELVERMPWDIPPTPAKGQYFVAKLYKSLDDYKLIAPPSSGGFYSRREKVFHVPYQALGIGRGSTPLPKGKMFQSDTLVHELTHMMMDRLLPELPIWFSEGSAEYVSNIPIINNSMRPADIQNAMKDYIHHMLGMPSRAKANYSFKTTSNRMVELLHTSTKRWHDNDGTAKAKTTAATPETNTVPPVDPMPTEPAMSAADTMAHQVEQYMHACLLFYYFMHLDSAQRGDPMLTFIDKVSDSAPQWQLYETAIGTYRARFSEYEKAFEAFTQLPGVEKLATGRIKYPQGMKPPAAPEPPRAPVDLNTLPDQDRGLSYIDVLTKGRSDEQMKEAFRAGYAKIGITIE